MPLNDTTSFYLEFADPEFEKPFRVYSGYLQDLAGLIAAEHGFAALVAEGVHASVLEGPGTARIKRRRLSEAERRNLDVCLRRCWQNLRRVLREVEEVEVFDEEANSWLPVQAYYAVFHGVMAFAIASGQRPPKDHTAARRLIADEVRRLTLPYPWSASCSGCPQTDTTIFAGTEQPARVHALSAPSPDTARDRLAMFLRTTRQKELERILDLERDRGRPPGGPRRRVLAAAKEQHAAKLHATTVFDLFWRLRKKANYDDADTFVLGAAGVRDAATFAQSLAYVTDGTIAALEALMAAYAGPDAIADVATSYADRLHLGSAIHQRASVWQVRAGRLATQPVGARR
ncbi:MAG: hypothetical protein JWR63_514 [Conexibacter sp.]|nr:hypothetical protein [Conexibacter sp.]